MGFILKHFEQNCLVVYAPALLLITACVRDTVTAIVLALCYAVCACLILYLSELADMDRSCPNIGRERPEPTLLPAMRFIFDTIMLVLTVSFMLPQLS